MYEKSWQETVKQENFINEVEIENILDKYKNPSDLEFETVLQKVISKKPFTYSDVAILLNSEKTQQIEKIFNLAKDMKKSVYGNRVVIFAPLYLGNKCTNLCTYCGFKASNSDIKRKTLNLNELEKEIIALEEEGHKRLIMVYGTHPDFSPNYIKETVKKAYETKLHNGEIRRININAAPLSIDEYKIVKEAEIGTYQIFQETYHEKTYNNVHPKGGEKSNFKWRLFGLSRAMEAGIDDVGIGALFGLYKWKYEVMGLFAHAKHLESTYGVGPHTISFPRLKEAHGVYKNSNYLVNDLELKRVIAILRLAVPYTGLILTARESAELRKECMDIGVSQIDAGTQIELQGYSKQKEKQNLKNEQFKIGDSRSLDDIILELIRYKYIPSFCTACYRLGRTGEHFMEFSKPGFIHYFCTPNAVLTLAEYLEDYASENTKKTGYNLINEIIEKEITKEDIKNTINKKLDKIKNGCRDIYY